jgi:hypothetical protein
MTDMTPGCTVPRRAQVALRVPPTDPNSPALKLADGNVYVFIYGWLQGDSDPYPGEIAYIVGDDSCPLDFPAWVSEGDLIFTDPAPPEPIDPPVIHI